MNRQKQIAVIDTETNYEDEVISIGIVVADSANYRILDKHYFILTPEYQKPALFGEVLSHCRVKEYSIVSREDAIQKCTDVLKKHNVKCIFAYNAAFDRNHLPELRTYEWYDIMRIAAYKQFNSKIPNDVKCCSSGRMKSGYRAEDMYRMLSGEQTYFEIHNALADAEDELEIMRMLGLDFSIFLSARI